MPQLGFKYKGLTDDYSGLKNGLGNFTDDAENVLEGGKNGGAIGAIAGFLLNAVSAFAQQAYQNKTQESFYEKYESPKARMEQMAQAGINPAAAAQGISGGSFAQMNAAGPSSGLGQGLAQSLGQLIQNQPLTDADVRLKNASVRTAETQADLFEEEAKNYGIQNKYAPDKFEADIDVLKSQKRINSATAAMMEAKAEYAREFAKADLDLLQETANELRQRIKEEEENIELMKTQEGLNKALEFKNNQDATHQQWINGFCQKYGWDPDGPMAQYLAYVADDKDQDADELLEGFKAYQQMMSETQANAQEQAKNEKDPIRKETLRLEEERDRKIAPLLKKIEKEQYTLDHIDPTNAIAKGRIESYNNQIENINKDYARRIRRLSSNKGTSLKFGPFGGSVNE